MKRLLVPLLLAVAGCSRDGAPKPPASAGVSEPVPVDVSAVTEVRMDRTLPIVGTLFAKDSATIAAEVEGRVEKTMSEFGDRVKEGQELALVDTDTYAALASLAGARIQQAKAAEVAAGQELRRQDELRKSGIASSSDHDSAVAAADEAHSAVKAAEANAEAAKAEFELVTKRLLRDFETFKVQKAADIQEILLNFVNLNIDFNRKSEQMWSDMVPVLSSAAVSASRTSGVSGINPMAAAPLPTPPAAAAPPAANPFAAAQEDEGDLVGV